MRYFNKNIRIVMVDIEVFQRYQVQLYFIGLAPAASSGYREKELSFDNYKNKILQVLTRGPI